MDGLKKRRKEENEGLKEGSRIKEDRREVIRKRG